MAIDPGQTYLNWYQRIALWLLVRKIDKILHHQRLQYPVTPDKQVTIDLWQLMPYHDEASEGHMAFVKLMRRAVTLTYVAAGWHVTLLPTNPFRLIFTDAVKLPE